MIVLFICHCFDFSVFTVALIAAVLKQCLPSTSLVHTFDPLLITTTINKRGHK